MAEDDTPADEGKDKARFAEEQEKAGGMGLGLLTCSGLQVSAPGALKSLKALQHGLAAQVRHVDTDVEYQILNEMRG